jgi:hypothetical protein
VRPWTASLLKMLFPCFLTVPRLTTSLFAITRLDAPAAIDGSVCGLPFDDD